ncbi:50S ribosomal protein L29, partial [Pseudomonas aeruginosa]
FNGTDVALTLPSQVKRDIARVKTVLNQQAGK